MSNLTRTNPLWESDPLPSRRMSPFWGDAIDRLMNASMLTKGGGGRWSPTIDVKETDGAYVFKAEVPGIKPDDIKVNVTSTGLTISGEKSEEQREEGDNFVHSERTYGAFERFFTFPDPVDPDKVKAEEKNGILTVTVQKSVPSKMHRVKIRSS